MARLPAKALTTHAHFYIALTTMVIGSQFFIAGFLGEMILRTRKNKNRYIIKDKI